MEIKNSDSCAIRYIHNIGDTINVYGFSHEESCKKFMLAFCKKELGAYRKPSNDGFFKDPGGYQGVTYCSEAPLYAIYLFNGNIEHKYAQWLADFITKHKLGKVTKSAVAENKAFHPGEHNAVYVWNPNPKAIIKWYDANKPEEKPKRARKPKGAV